MSDSRPAALITGAGSGIGRATALELARRGYRLALVGRRAEHLRETGAASGGAEGADWIAISADVGVQAQVCAMVARTVEAFGRLDALVNNAGYAPPAEVEHKTPDMIRDIFAVNAVAPATAVAQAWPHFKRQFAATGVGGVVVNVSSYATVDPFPTLVIYASAKGAVNVLARAVANAGRAWGVRGFSVAPGAVETEMLRGILPEDVLPRSRTLEPSAVAAVIAECVTGKRDAENGQTIFLPSP